MQARARHYTMSVPEDPNDWQPLRSTVLPSPFLEKERKLKREFTAQLYTRRGPFWDAVAKMRARWSINAQRRLPELPTFVVWPENISEVDRSRWLSDLFAIEDEVISQQVRTRRGTFWQQFLAACVLYDPPDLNLLEFAAYQDPGPAPLSPAHEGGPRAPLPTPEDIKERLSRVSTAASQRFLQGQAASEDNVPSKPSKKTHWSTNSMSAPPIVTLPDYYEVEEVERWFWQQTMQYLIDRYIRPAGYDVEVVLHDLLDSSGLMEEYLDRREEVSEQHYIVVDEHTSEGDVESARRMIRGTQEQGAGGRPSRDRLVALQCAILHDNYNETDPTDRRFGTWTYRRLAEEFKEYGVHSQRSAEGHIKLGRQLLKNRST